MLNKTKDQFYIIKYFIVFLFKINILLSHNVIDGLDIERFMGRWYVISLIPNWIEEGATNSYDDYVLNDDGTIGITYTAIRNGKVKTIKQKGIIVDENIPSRWEIQFLKPWIPFYKAPYELIILDEDYNYMVVGYPDNNFGWIMARETSIKDEVYNEILNSLKKDFGYDESFFKKVIHDN